MTKQDTQIVGDEGSSLAGEIKPSSHRPAEATRKPVIQIHRAFPPPPPGSEDAIELDGNPQSIGSIAVRLMATWSLPRMSLALSL
jgi:hypothetical protein